MRNKCEWDKGEFYPCDEHYKKWSRMQTPPSPLLEWSFCPFCGADIRKPVEIKVGTFGKVTLHVGVGPDIEEWGFLSKVSIYGGRRKYYIGNGCAYDEFIPGLPEGFNQDGTPKENEDE